MSAALSIKRDSTLARQRWSLGCLAGRACRYSACGAAGNGYSTVLVLVLVLCLPGSPNAVWLASP